jgi:hypothetical protein
MRTKTPIMLFAWKYIIYPLFVICQIPFALILHLFSREHTLKITDKRFNYDTFVSLENFDKITYCYKFFEYLGEGASRTVFRIDKNHVLKISKKHSNTQNKCESYLFKHPMDMFAKVYEVGKNSDWVVSEYVTPAKSEDFERITGVPFNKISAWLIKRADLYFFFKFFRNTRFNKKDLAEIDNLSLFNDIKKFPPRGLMDISKLNSWGVRKYKDGTEKLIIVDSGMCFKDYIKND